MGLHPIQLAVKLFVSGDGQLTAAEKERSRRAITWLMTGLIEVNREWIETYKTPSLYASRVLYKLEVNTEIWQDVPTTLLRGFGDCEDLACYRCAELQAGGVAAMPYITWRPAGERTIYHALVRWPDGRIEDPSRALGMHGAPIVRRPVFVGVDTP